MLRTLCKENDLNTLHTLVMCLLSGYLGACVVAFMVAWQEDMDQWKAVFSGCILSLIWALWFMGDKV